MTPVLQRTNLLTVALLEDYKNHSIRSYKRTIIKDGDEHGYYQNRIEEIKAGKVDYSYEIEEGRKYYKIVMVSNQRSVHAFVDKKTGDVYSPQVGRVLPSMCATTSLTATAAMSALSGQTGLVGTLHGLRSLVDASRPLS